MKHLYLQMSVFGIIIMLNDSWYIHGEYNPNFSILIIHFSTHSKISHHVTSLFTADKFISHILIFSLLLLIVKMTVMTL